MVNVWTHKYWKHGFRPRHGLCPYALPWRKHYQLFGCLQTLCGRLEKGQRRPDHPTGVCAPDSGHTGAGGSVALPTFLGPRPWASGVPYHACANSYACTGSWPCGCRDASLWRMSPLWQRVTISGKADFKQKKPRPYATLVRRYAIVPCARVPTTWQIYH